MVRELALPLDTGVDLPEDGPALGGTALSRLGHDLRGPLTGIIGLAGMMARKLEQGAVDPAQQVRQLRMMKTSAAELLDTVERVITFVKLGAPDPGGPGAVLDCRDVVREVSTALAGAAAARHRRVNLDLPGEPLPATTSPEQLRRALTELLDNAIKYSDQPDLRVHARAEHGSGRVVLEVSDDGPGLTAEDQERIFLPFERGSAAGERAEPGTGLGLCLARRAAARAGATLSLRTAPAGTTAIITLEAQPAA